MVRKRLIITGNVQRVSYRAYVLQCASVLGVAGKVKNLPDGTVEVYCEAQAPILKKFIKALDVHGDEDNFFEMNVKRIDIFAENEKAYHPGKPPGRFDKFTIDYGRKVDAVERESLEREEFTLVAGQNITKRLGHIDERLEKGFAAVGTETEVVGHNVDAVGLKVKGMHMDMNAKFEGLDKKYHVLGEHLLETSQTIAGMNVNIAHMNENNAKTNDNLKKLIEGNAKTNDNIAKMNEDLSVLARALLKLVESDIKKKGRHSRTAKG
jgi:acylphosphatase